MIDNRYRNKHPRSISINNNNNHNNDMAKVMTDNNDPPPKASRLSLFSPSGKLPGAGDQDEISQLRGTFLSRRPNSLGAELGGGRGRGGRGPGRGPGGRGLVKAESYRIGRRHSAEIGSLSSSTNSANRRSSDPEYGEYICACGGRRLRVESPQYLSRSFIDLIYCNLINSPL